MDRAFLVIASVLGFLGVAFGAFVSHALRARLSSDRLSQFDTGVRYQLWHALALFAVVLVDLVRIPAPPGAIVPLVLVQRPIATLAGWFFIAGVVLFSGSLYALALTGNRRWAVVTPFGGVAFLLGWLWLLITILAM